MRTFSFIFSPYALEDIEEACLYYELIQANLQKRFITQLQITLNSIKRNPYFASVRYDDIRCAQIKKFPFLVHYHINQSDSLVTIIAIYSTHREPLG